MTEMRVTLKFACCECEEPINVTVKCQGKGLQSNTDIVANISVPCPDCGEVNQVFFEPNGTLHGIRSARPRLTLPEPSLN